MRRKFRIGFIGTGVMGHSMAGHLLDAGNELFVHNRTRAKAEGLVQRGATWCHSLEEMASQCETVITIVGFPKDVEQTYLGEKGLLATARPETLFIDMTTSRPDLAVSIAEAAQSKGCEALDAPVSGGDVGAQKATLSIMVGGSSKAFDRALPLFSAMGKNVVHHGPAGCGQHCKMVNQISIAAGMIGICEALTYAEKSGLDAESVLKSIQNGAAGSWNLSNLAPRMLDGDYQPGFYVKHFIKDLKIAIESARKMELELPGLTLAIKLYEQLAAEGGSEMGTQALFKLYRK